MLKLLYNFELVVSVLLIIAILLQNKGSGLSATFGGDFSGFHTKRGLEKFLTVVSAVLGGLFILNAFLIFVLSAR